MTNDPRNKNGLGENLTSQNKTVGKVLGITTAARKPVYDNFDTMTAGQRGPAMLQDIWLQEKLAQI